SLESQEATVLYLPYVITLDEIVNQIEVAGFKAVVKSKPRQLKLSASEVERLLSAPKQTAVSSPEEKISEQSTDSTITTLLQVTGMHCKSCVVNIQDNISKLPGVSSVVVSLENRQALIHHNPKQISLVELQKAIEALPPGNFKAMLSTSPEPSFHQPLVSVADIHIEGMTCGSCVQSIEGMISQKKGVRSAQVSLANHQGTFEYDPLVTTPEELRVAIEDMGFDAFLP
ncbi:hypothetical protein M9458_027900, partial [Cirrhinus mrigala]